MPHSQPQPQKPPILLMTYHLEAGGSERQACAMAVELMRRGWPVHYACLRIQGQFLELLRSAGIPVVEYPLPSFFSPKAASMIWKLRGYLRRHGIQLLHAFDGPTRLLGVPAGRLARLPAVLTSHRGSYTFFENNRTILRAYQWMDAWADGVVANCKAMSDELTGMAGISAAHVHLNYNGIDADRYAPGEPRLRPAYLDGMNQTVIGCIAGLRPEKDLLTLVEAFAMVHREFPKTRLLLVGENRDRILSRIAQLRLSSVANIEPETRDVENWLRCLDIFVLPSLTEAFSNSLMEAMSSQRICIASRVGGNPELIDHGVNGLLFEPGDSHSLASQLRTALSDPQSAGRLAEAARARIRSEFSVEAAADRLEAIYRLRLGK
jgi:glycosyltransferase involved in cell wall biosynthesis